MVEDKSKGVGQQTKEEPATDGIAVTPNDSTDLPCVSRALYIGTAGTLKVTMQSGVVLTFAAVAAGLLPIRCTRVWDTGTDAEDIVALW